MKHAAPASEAGPITAIWQKIVTYILITLVGFNLRSVLLGVPPVLPLIQHDLGLSYTLTGFLTALPVLVLAVGAWPSGLLAERIGARLSVSIGLGLLATGTLLRAFRLSIPSLILLHIDIEHWHHHVSDGCTRTDTPLVSKANRPGVSSVQRWTDFG